MNQSFQSTSVEAEDLRPSGGGASRLSDLYAGAYELFRRRFLTFALIVAATFGVAIVLIAMISPTYDAVTRIRLDPTRNLAASQREGGNNALSDEAIDTEVSELSSDELAREVVRRLSLTGDAEFRRGAEAAAKDGRPMSHDAQIQAASQQLLANLDVRREKLTYIIAVRYRSRDPRRASEIANSLAETYIATRVGGRTSTAQTQAAIIADQARKLDAETRSAESRVAQYRAQTGTVEGGTLGTITDQQVAPLSSQLASAQSDAAEARAKLAEARRQVASGGLDAVSEVRSSPVIADLRRQRAEVSRNMAEINSRYGERYPETIKVRQQLQQLDENIKEEANRAVGSLQAEADAASARASSLAASLNALKGQQAANTRNSVTAEALERDAASKRAGLDKLTQQRLEAEQSAGNSMANAVIVDRAQTPTRPASPNRPLLAAMAGSGALALGLCVILLQEVLGTGMRSVAEIESRLKLPVLASVPRVPKGKRRMSPADLVVEQPASIFAEALRNLRTSILGVGRTGTNIIALTSALPDEGKTVTALSFARVLGMNGTRTLLVDCDLRKASLRDLTDTPAEAGLVEVLRGAATVDQAIVADRVANVDLLFTTQKLFTAEDMFGSGRMATLLDELKGRYQVIVLDLPPVLGVADSRALSVLAGITVLILRWGGTPARAAQQALTWLRGDGSNVVGAVFTMVDPNAEAIGGLYYSSKYAAYYREA